MNKVILIGRLTKDLEIRKTTNGTSTTSFNLAVERRFKSKDVQEPTADFVNCVAWRQTADYLCSYANKGAMIAISGHIQTRNYEGQNGRVYVTEVVVEEANIMRQANDKQQSQQQAPQHNYPEHSDSYDEFRNTQNLNISSDDLPFY